jgi:hypothetical protein
MKKLKKLWVENRVLLVLFIIVLACIITILGVCINYFFGSSKSSYGDRLEGIEEVEITEEIKNNFIEKMNSDDLISSTTIKSIGKIVYITLNFEDNVTLVEAESKALSSLTEFQTEYLDFYDFNYTLVGNKTDNSDGFLIMGAKNVNGTGLVWNNNTEVETDSE